MYFQKIGCGKPVVFLHGWGCDGSIFMPVAEKLPEFKCYLPDFNGFGKSPDPPQSGWSVENYADELFRFFRMHNLSDSGIVAHSFGCRVAIVFAAKYPQLVSKLLLFAPAGVRTHNFRRWLKVRSYKFKKILRLKSALCCGSADYRACPEALRNTFVKVVNRDLSRYAVQVKCPTLILNGRNDAETSLAHARKLNKLMKTAVLKEIDGDHFALFLKPEAFAKTIYYFLGEEA